MFSQKRDCDSCRPSEVALPQNVPSIGAGQALLVEAVAGLVEDGEEAGEEVVLVLARRQADVAGGEAGGERVRGLVEPPGLEVEADRGRERARPGRAAPAAGSCGARTRRRAAAGGDLRTNGTSSSRRPFSSGSRRATRMSGSYWSSSAS